jgi:catechol-2,3-dioxygenase
LIEARVPLGGASGQGTHEALHLRDPDENGLGLA